MLGAPALAGGDVQVTSCPVCPLGAPSLPALGWPHECTGDTMTIPVAQLQGNKRLYLKN